MFSDLTARKIFATKTFALLLSLALTVFTFRASAEAIDLKPVTPAAARAQISSVALNEPYARVCCPLRGERKCPL